MGDDIVELGDPLPKRAEQRRRTVLLDHGGRGNEASAGRFGEAFATLPSYVCFSFIRRRAAGVARGSEEARRVALRAELLREGERDSHRPIVFDAGG